LRPNVAFGALNATNATLECSQWGWVGFAADRQVGMAIVCWYLHEAVTALAVEAPDLRQVLADSHARGDTRGRRGWSRAVTGRCGRRATVVSGEWRSACGLREQ
jgi:hypothetical protein